jgi:hypothetical protein
VPSRLVQPALCGPGKQTVAETLNLTLLLFIIVVVQINEYSQVESKISTSIGLSRVQKGERERQRKGSRTIIKQHQDFLLLELEKYEG